MKFPENINLINQPFQSRAIGYSLFSRTMDRINDEWNQELGVYTSYVSQVVDKLDYQNRIEGKRLKAQYQVLDEVSDLIEEFHLNYTG